ncbi:hypothetical protein [Sphingomonas sp. UYP23]
MTVTMSTVWDRTSECLGERLRVMAPIVELGLFVPLALLGICMQLMGSSGPTVDLVLGIIVLLSSLLTSWAGLAITALALDPAISRADAVQAANRRFLPVLGIGLVTLAVVLVLAEPIGIALNLSGTNMAALAAGTLQPGDVNGGAMAFASLYSLVLVVVLFWAYARCVVLVTPILLEERRGLGVYRRSFELTRHIAWKVIGVVFLYGVVSWVASAAAKSVFGTVFLLMFGGEGRVTLAGLLTQVIVANVSTLFSLLAVVFLAKLYLAAREANVARS